jgi:hypothetical protein
MVSSKVKFEREVEGYQHGGVIWESWTKNVGGSNKIGRGDTLFWEENWVGRGA